MTKETTHTRRNIVPDSQLRTLYGDDASVLQRQQARYATLHANFGEAYGGSQEPVLFSTPGRTEVGGNHTDHNHGRVLAAAVGLDIIAAAARNGRDGIRIRSEGYPPFEVDTHNTAPVAADRLTSKALVRGVCDRMRALGMTVGGFDAVIDGIVPSGAGLSSSAAFEVLMVTILDHLYNDGTMAPTLNAQIAQYAENEHFGKPCGLMDQTTCAVGGLVTIDFKDVERPVVRQVKCDLSRSGFVLFVTDTGGSHADLNDDYASLEHEMKATARALGYNVLRLASREEALADLSRLRTVVSDRAILRALHFFDDDERVVAQVQALESGRMEEFLRLVIESGRSSWMLCQNCYSSSSVERQGLCVALALSEHLLAGRGAWRVHGGGFEGTIQAFVPRDLADEYRHAMEKVFGVGSCQGLFVRQPGTVCL